jgi:hypothetical protein
VYREVWIFAKLMNGAEIGILRGVNDKRGLTEVIFGVDIHERIRV